MTREDVERAKIEIREAIEHIENEANRIDDRLAPFPFLYLFRMDMFTYSEVRVMKMKKLLDNVERQFPTTKVN